jgi:hypothetical protein
MLEPVPVGDVGPPAYATADPTIGTRVKETGVPREYDRGKTMSSSGRDATP